MGALVGSHSPAVRGTKWCSNSKFAAGTRSNYWGCGVEVLYDLPAVRLPSQASFVVRQTFIKMNAERGYASRHGKNRASRSWYVVREGALVCRVQQIKNANFASHDGFSFQQPDYDKRVGMG